MSTTTTRQNSKSSEKLFDLAPLESEHEDKKIFECSICNVNLMVYFPFKNFLTLWIKLQFMKEISNTNVVLVKSKSMKKRKHSNALPI